ncbi:MAG: HEPN domain-containing protein [Proteiniphilum sp.]
MREELTEEMITALVAYRLERAKDTVQEAVDMLEKDHYNAAVNRLYYACYYAVSALLVKNNIQAHTHSGVKQMFGMSFIVNGKLPRTYNITYTELFDKRHSGDYDDFKFIR